MFRERFIEGRDKGQAGTRTGAVKEDGELVVGQTTPIPQIDQHTINAAVQQQLLSVLWNGLTKWGPGDSTQPDLAFKVKVGLGVRGDVACVALARELRSAGFPVIATNRCSAATTWQGCRPYGRAVPHGVMTAMREAAPETKLRPLFFGDVESAALQGASPAAFAPPDLGPPASGTCATPTKTTGTKTCSGQWRRRGGQQEARQVRRHGRTGPASPTTARGAARLLARVIAFANRCIYLSLTRTDHVR